MPDPYVPTLESLVLTDAENAAVAAALATARPWDWAPAGDSGAAIASVKRKVRDLHMARHRDRCCYCRKNLHGGGHFVIDREHVLPKSRAAYRLLAYEIWNLGIACKRCNMQYKRSKIDFVVDPTDGAALRTSVNYRLIHPNYDRYRDHIRIASYQDDDITVVKYTKLGSAKGDYTYDYFNLRELEVGSFDVAQGAPDLADLGAGALAAKALAVEFDQ